MSIDANTANPLLWIAVTLYWGLFFVLIPLVLSLAVSVLWMPFGVGSCMLLARRRGLSVRYYGIIGAIYSLPSILPCIYLVVRLAGRRLPTPIVLIGYCVAYGFWVFFLLSSYLHLVWSSELLDRIGLRLIVVVHFATYIGSIVAVVSAWVLIRDYKRRQNLRNVDRQSSDEYKHAPSDVIYLLPFVFAGIQMGLIVLYLFG